MTDVIDRRSSTAEPSLGDGETSGQPSNRARKTQGSAATISDPVNTEPLSDRSPRDFPSPLQRIRASYFVARVRIANAQRRVRIAWRTLFDPRLLFATAQLEELKAGTIRRGVDAFVSQQAKILAVTPNPKQDRIDALEQLLAKTLDALGEIVDEQAHKGRNAQWIVAALGNVATFTGQELARINGEPAPTPPPATRSPGPRLA